MNRTFYAISMIALLSLFSTKISNQVQRHSTKVENPKIQMVMLLDTSNSMDGMIEQAKSQLWKMVNELATSTRDGNSPDIEIALYEYGNDNLSIKGNYIRQIVPLTNDLDEISQELFNLKTQGGSEYCGAVMLHSVLNLDWSKDQKDLKMIVISGNEPFDQGPVTPEEACLAALKKGISITTVFCGSWKEGVQTGWEEGAKCGAGEYLNIDTDEKVVHIPTPYDDDIIALNDSLNSTYMAFGRRGIEKMQLQKVQDSNAMAYSSANVRERASFKAKKQYNNASWDLVDNYDSGDWEDVEETSLPENLKGKDKAEVENEIVKQKTRRERFQSQIRDLEAKAKKHEIAERKKMTAEAETNTLDEVMNEAIHKLAKRKGYKF